MVQMAAGRLLVETVAVVAAVVVVSHPSSYTEIAVGEFPAAEIRLLNSVLASKQVLFHPLLCHSNIYNDININYTNIVDEQF